MFASNFEMEMEHGAPSDDLNTGTTFATLILSDTITSCEWSVYNMSDWKSYVVNSLLK